MLPWVTTQTTASQSVVHRDARQRPNQGLGRTSGSHRSVNNRSGARGGSGPNERGLCENMMEELRFKDGFDGVPLCIDNMSTPHVASNRTCSPEAKHIALRYFFVQELVEDFTPTIHYVKTPDQLADVGIKCLNKQRDRELINKSGTLEPERRRRPLQAPDLLCDVAMSPRALAFKKVLGGGCAAIKL